MSLKDQTTLRIVLYEGEGAQPFDAADRYAAASALLEKGFAITRVAGAGRVAPADRVSLLVLGRFSGGRAPSAEDFGGAGNLRFPDVTGLGSNRITSAVASYRGAYIAVEPGVFESW